MDTAHQLSILARLGKETLEILGDSAGVKALVKAEAAIARGDVVRGAAAVRALRPPTLR